MTANELSKYFGIGERRIQQLSKAGILPKDARGEYDLANCTRAYIQYLENWRSATDMPVSMRDLVRCCGTSPAVISVLVRKGKIPKLGRGRYDLATGIRVFIQYLQEQAADKKTEDSRT